MKCESGQVYHLTMLPDNHDSFKKRDIVWIENQFYGKNLIELFIITKHILSQY